MYRVDWNQAFLSRPSKPSSVVLVPRRASIGITLLALGDFLGVVLFHVELVPSEEDGAIVFQVYLQTAEAWGMATIDEMIRISTVQRLEQ